MTAGWHRHMDFAGHELVRELPIQLRKTICLQVNESMMRRFSIFAESEERFIAALACNLRPEVYLPDEYILTLGQVSHCCYFIERGRVNIIWQTEKKHAPRFVVREDYFGELGLFTTKQHFYSARAMTHVDTMVLDRQHFEEVMRAFPAESVHVADKLAEILPKEAIKKASCPHAQSAPSPPHAR